VFLTREEVNSSIISSNIHSMSSLPDLHHQQLMTLGWCWVDRYSQNGAVTVSLGLLHIVDGNTLVMDSSEQITYNYLIYKTKHCGGSIDAWGVVALTQTILPIKAVNTSIMGKCCSPALGSYKMQHTKSLPLGWRSFSDRSCDHVTIAFAQNGRQYVDNGHIP